MSRLNWYTWYIDYVQKCVRKRKQTGHINLHFYSKENVYNNKLSFMTVSYLAFMQALHTETDTRTSAEWDRIIKYTVAIYRSKNWICKCFFFLFITTFPCNMYQRVESQCWRLQSGLTDLPTFDDYAYCRWWNSWLGIITGQSRPKVAFKTNARHPLFGKTSWKPPPSLPPSPSSTQSWLFPFHHPINTVIAHSQTKWNIRYSGDDHFWRLKEIRVPRLLSRGEGTRRMLLKGAEKGVGIGRIYPVSRGGAGARTSSRSRCRRGWRGAGARGYPRSCRRTPCDVVFAAAWRSGDARRWRRDRWLASRDGRSRFCLWSRRSCSCSARWRSPRDRNRRFADGAGRPYVSPWGARRRSAACAPPPRSPSRCDGWADARRCTAVVFGYCPRPWPRCSPAAVPPCRAPISRPSLASAGRCRPSGTGRPALRSRCPPLCVGADGGSADDCSAGDCGNLPREPRRHLDGDCARVATTNDRAPSLFLRFVFLCKLAFSSIFCSIFCSKLEKIIERNWKLYDFCCE